MLNLRRKIIQSCQVEGESAHTFVLRVKSLNDDLACIDECIKDVEIVQVLLNGLLECHANLVQSFAIQKSLPSLEDLQQVLVAEEHRMQAKHGGTSNHGGEEVLFSKGKNMGKIKVKSKDTLDGKGSSSSSSGKQGDRSKLKCFYCGKKGHFSIECLKRKREQGEKQGNLIHSKDEHDGACDTLMMVSKLLTNQV